MKIAVIGTGYVGLVAGACFADNGNDVYCVDNNELKIKKLKEGIIPIYEPGLEPIVKRAIKEERIQFTTSKNEAVKNAEIVFMAVNTPAKEDGQPNLTFLKAATEEVAKAMNGYKLIVNKSTVPVGAHQMVAEWVSENTNHPFDVVSNPEFLKEGTAVDDFLKPDRIVIGTRSEEAFEKMERLYKPFVRQGNPVLQMDPVSAELTKYACNSFLATRISFMNELSVLCEKVGGDIDQIRQGMSTDERIGRYFLYAGAGYGGSCFPKDVKALLDTGKNNNLDLRIIRAAEEANQAQKEFVFEKVTRFFGGREQLRGKTVALWGLAFKPNTDDIRDAPALLMIDRLLDSGAKVQAFDPVASENVREIYGDKVLFTSKSYDALEGADLLVLLTEWNEFKEPDFEKMKNVMKSPALLDGRNVYDPAEMRSLGFKYDAIGRLT